MPMGSKPFVSAACAAAVPSCVRVQGRSHRGPGPRARSCLRALTIVRAGRRASDVTKSPKLPPRIPRTPPSLTLDCSPSPTKAGRAGAGPSPARRPSPSPARRPSPSPSTAQRRASPSPSTTPVVDSPCRMQYKMRQDSNGWRQLGERYKKVHPSRPSDEHGGLLEGWGIPYIMPSKKHDESPTSSEFFSRHMQALGTQLQSAMGLEGEGAADKGNSLAQGSSETIARCVLCGDKTGGRSGCVLCGDHAGDTKTPQAMPWRGRACKAPGRHASTVEAFEATKPGRPVLAKYLKC
eukprot:Tamp_20988.p2 GENE.Tamp_20988~~Tamp_20988.p2  ORF type:complete len:294 (-),score=29.21 Tamp_20988:222-1103(-)